MPNDYSSHRHLLLCERCVHHVLNPGVHTNDLFHGGSEIQLNYALDGEHCDIRLSKRPIEQAAERK